MASSAQTLEQCLRYMFRPLAGFCTRHGIGLQSTIQVFKEILVEEAVAELERSSEAVSNSRISIMTGLHRADISSIRRMEPRKEQAENVVSRVIDRWHQDQRFCTKDNKPRILPIEGMNSPFVELVQSVSRALNPYTVLFQLERSGVVERTPRGLKLVTRIFVTKDLSEGYSLLGEDVRDLMNTVAENLEGSLNPPNLHIKTEYDSIPARHFDSVREWILREGSAFHRRLRAFLGQLDTDFSPSADAGEGRLRVAVGSFSRSEKID